jgi:geranylgeranyl diphosphate synthase type I
LDSSANIADIARRIEEELRGVVTTRDMQLYRIMSYHMGWDGEEPARAKRRDDGVLCLLAAMAAGGDPDTALPAAAAIELVHGFCEIHDDVQGGKPNREGRDAVWWKWGPAQAINAGDGMHALARLAMSGLLKRGLTPARTFQALHVLDEASLRTCEGRFLDLEAQERVDMTVDSYLEMAERKTGSLTSCAMRLGGLAVTEEEHVLDSLASCGARIGMAAHISGDMREMWAGEEGPSPEVMNKKKLLPIVYALEKANKNEKRRLGELFFKRVLEPGDALRLGEVVESMGVRRHCEELVRDYRDQAVSALDRPGIDRSAAADIETYVDSILG